MSPTRFLIGALLATAAISAQAAIDLVLEVNPSHFEPDHLAIPPQEPVPAAFSLSFTIDTEQALDIQRGARVGTALFAMHTDPHSPVHDQLTRMSSLWIRSQMLKDGTATFEQAVLSGVAPSRTSLVLKTADASELEGVPTSAYAYSRTVTLKAFGDVIGGTSSEHMPLDEQALASWLTARIGQSFAGAYNETIQRAIGDGQTVQRSLMGDVVIKSVSVVPEPSSMAMSLIGMASLAGWAGAGRRKSRAQGA